MFNGVDCGWSGSLFIIIGRISWMKGRIGMQSLIGICPKTNTKTKCQGKAQSQNSICTCCAIFLVLVLGGVIVY